jgi:hypothetical protein
MTKTVKPVIPVIKDAEFKVWCEHCSIRIAPNEEQIVFRDRTYHRGCYVKLPGVARPKS